MTQYLTKLNKIRFVFSVLAAARQYLYEGKKVNTHLKLESFSKKHCLLSWYFVSVRASFLAFKSQGVSLAVASKQDSWSALDSRAALHRSVPQFHPGSQQCPFTTALHRQPAAMVIHPCQGILLSSFSLQLSQF